MGTYRAYPRAMRPKPSSIPSSNRTILNSLRSVRCCVVFVVYAISDFLCTCSTRNARRKVVFEEESALLVRARNSKSLLLLVSHCSVHPCIEFHDIDTLRSRREASWTVRCGDGPDPVSEGFPRQRILRGSLYTHSRITPTTTSQSPFAARTNSCQPWLTFW